MLKRFPKILALMALIILPFSGCLHDGGTEIPNEIRGTLLTQAGTPSAGAKVALFPVDYAPGESDELEGIESHTDASGSYSFKDIPDGEYNIVGADGGQAAYRDSILISGGLREVGSDTLRLSGSLSGKVRLQPQHDMRTAVVQILGTNYFVNVDSAGRFFLPQLPRGTYTMAVSVTLPNYTPLFRSVTVESGRADTLAELLEPFYSGIYTVSGLRATPDSAGAIALRWDKTGYSKLKAYVVYRALAGSSSYTQIGKTSDTAFVDTVYSPVYGRSPSATQYAFTDTLPHAFDYRVRIENQSDAIGPFYGTTSATAIPPARKFRSGRWHALPASPVFALAGLDVAVLRDKLWAIGASSSGKLQVWSSPNGSAWTKLADSIPLAGEPAAQITAFRDTLWISGVYVKSGAFSNYLLKSTDGLQWTIASANLLPVHTPKPSFNTGPDSSRMNFAFLEFNDRLWTLGGTGYSYTHGLKSKQYSSMDAATWTEKPIEPDTTCCVGVALLDARHVAAFNGKLWAAGGYDYEINYGSNNYKIWSSADGQLWTPVPATSSPLPRYGHSLASHGNALWMVGGFAGYATTSSGGTSGGAVTNQVWRSMDGIQWQLSDLNAPFGPRLHAATLSFQGKLWVFGGQTQTQPMGPGDFVGDAWYYE